MFTAVALAAVKVTSHDAAPVEATLTRVASPSTKVTVPPVAAPSAESSTLLNVKVKA